jgi:hypothetical protein
VAAVTVAAGATIVVFLSSQSFAIPSEGEAIERPAQGGDLLVDVVTKKKQKSSQTQAKPSACPADQPRSTAPEIAFLQNLDNTDPTSARGSGL